MKTHVVLPAALLLLAVGAAAAEEPRPGRRPLEEPRTEATAAALVDLLHSADPAVRAAAVAALARCGAEAHLAMPALADVVLAGGPGAPAAAIALGRIAGAFETGSEAELVLRARLAAGHADAAVALAFAHLPDADVLARVEALARDAGSTLRREAVEVVLLRRDLRSDLAEVEASLDDPDLAVRLLAARRLCAKARHVERALARAREGLVAPEPESRVLALDAFAAASLAAKDDLAAIAARLSDADPEVRAAAARAVGACGPYAADQVVRLGALAADPVAFVRYSAVDALEGIGANSAAVPAEMERFAADPDAQVRLRVVERIGDAGSKASLHAGALALALRDGDRDVRSVALQASQAIDPLPDALLAPILGLLRDPEANLRSKAVVVLARLPSFDPGPFLPGLLAVLDEGGYAKWSAARLVARAGGAGIDALLARSRGASKDETMAIAEALGGLDASAVSDRPEVRRIVLLGLVGGRFADEGARADWVTAIARDAGLLLEALLAAQDDFARERAAGMLAAAGPEGIRALAQAMREGDEEIAWTAGQAFDLVSADAAWPHLRGLAGDDDFRVRAAALHALSASHGPLSPEASRATTDSLRDDSWRVRWAATMVFNDRVVPSDALAPLVALLGDRHEIVRGDARSVLADQGRAAGVVAPLLLARLRAAESPAARADLLGLVAWIASPDVASVTDAVLSVLPDPDDTLALAAVHALEVLRPADPRLVPALVAALGREALCGAAARLLGRLGPAARDAAPALEKAVAIGNRVLRKAASKALPAVRGDVDAWVSLLEADLGGSGYPRAAEQLGALGPRARRALSALRATLAADSHASKDTRAAATGAIALIEEDTHGR